MQLLAVDNGKLTINLHAGQSKAWDSVRRFIFIIAGTQSGKTSFEPLWLDREIQRKLEGRMYVYIMSEPGLFTVGFYDPDGKWHSDSDHDTREAARKRVAYLNGANVSFEE